MNCWEYKNCGREPGGTHEKEFGVCPAATAKIVDGIHKGKNGGRCCWAVAGTLCGGTVQGGFGSKVSACIECDFFKKTWREEQGDNYKSPTEILSIINTSKSKS